MFPRGAQQGTGVKSYSCQGLFGCAALTSTSVDVMGAAGRICFARRASDSLNDARNWLTEFLRRSAGVPPLRLGLSVMITDLYRRSSNPKLHAPAQRHTTRTGHTPTRVAARELN